MDGLAFLLLWTLFLGFAAGYLYGTRRSALGTEPSEAAHDEPRWIPQPEATDPVCGNTISTERARPSVYDGWVYYFCCEECRVSFETKPDAYVSKSGSNERTQSSFGSVDG